MRYKILKTRKDFRKSMGATCNKPLKSRKLSSKYRKPHVIQTLLNCEKRFQQECRPSDKLKEQFVALARNSLSIDDAHLAEVNIADALCKLNNSVKYLRTASRITPIINAIEMTEESLPSLRPILNSLSPIFMSDVAVIDIEELRVLIKEF